jgi:hypothetical protein
MRSISFLISLAFLLLPGRSLLSDPVEPVSGTYMNIKVKVVLPPSVLQGPDRPSCSTYDKGALVHQQSSLGSNYSFELPPSYRKRELWVSCSHPGFEDSGGELGPAYFSQGAFARSLFLKFPRPKLIQNVIVQRNNSVLNRMQFQARLPAPTFSNIEVPAAGNFKKLRFAGMNVPFVEGSEFEGTPEVPVLTPLLVVPRGASIEAIRVVPNGQTVYRDVRLAPVAPSRPEQPDYTDTQAKGFNAEVYNGPRISIGAKLYEEPINLGEFKLVKLALHLVSYDSVKQELTVPTSVDVTIQFQNSSACYRLAASGQDGVEKAIQQQFPALVQKAINFRDVSATPSCPRPITPVLLRAAPEPSSMDYVIVSHPSLTAAAEKLALHKRDLGWYSKVIISDGRDLDAMKADVQRLQPKWLLILGDAEFVATYYHNKTPYIVNRFDRSFAAGDTWYAQGTDDRLNPGLFSIGRLPVDSAAEAMRLVNRIIEYERKPNAENAFYQNPMWLANVDYALDLEAFYRDAAVQYGFEPRRFYHQGDGDLPDDLASIPRVNWNAGADQINGQLNSTSAAVVLHRGHADWYGWQAPQYSTEDIDGLTKANVRSPFVLSINCSSGFFDNETAAALAVPPPEVRRGSTPYMDSDPNVITFAEKFIRNDHGAIGVIADTRQSDTALNKTLAEGAIRSIYGHAGTQANPFMQGRLGQVLLGAKAEVVANHTSVREIGTQLLIYNLLGDPGIYLHKQSPYVVSGLRFDRATHKGEFEIRDPQCRDCRLPEAERSGLIVSVRRLNGDRSILARTLPSSRDGFTFAFDFAGRDWTAEEIQITVSGPALRPEFLESVPARANLKVQLSGTPLRLKEGPNPGSSFTVTVTNAGQATAGGTRENSTRGYMVDLILSRDKILPQGWAVFSPNFFEDVLIRGGRASNTDNIPPGKSQTFVFRDIEIPRGASGRFCLGASVDPGRVIAEEREDDNSACLEINVVAP